MTNRSIINTFKFHVPRHWLFFSIAAIWMFASLRIFMTAWAGIQSTHTPVLLFILVSGLGSLIFTRLVFNKVTVRYILRIRKIESTRTSIFNMMSVKSYLLLMFMIAMGITFSKLHILPVNIFSMFLGALGLSLFTSAIQFLREWRLKPLMNTD